MHSDAIYGGCLCGSVRYEATGQPYDISHIIQYESPPRSHLP